MHQTQMNATKKCCDYLLERLGWNWEHPRVTSWMERVREHYDWGDNVPLPEFVLLSLSKFLNIYLMCDNKLGAFDIKWNSPHVAQIQTKFRLEGKFYAPVGTLSLDGYKYLNEKLDRLGGSHFDNLSDDDIAF